MYYTFSCCIHTFIDINIRKPTTSYNHTHGMQVHNIICVMYLQEASSGQKYTVAYNMMRLFMYTRIQVVLGISMGSHV